jgi:hypothetical protein
VTKVPVKKRVEWIIVGSVTAIILMSLPFWWNKAFGMCDPQYPDYPGCTAAQVRAIQPHTRHIAHHRYRRGDYGKIQHAHLTHHQRQHLQKLYHHAVLRWQRDHKLAGPMPAHFVGWLRDNGTTCWVTAEGYIDSACRGNEATDHSGANAIGHALGQATKATLECTTVGLGSAEVTYAWAIRFQFFDADPELLAAAGGAMVTGAGAGGTLCAINKIAGWLGWHF